MTDMITYWPKDCSMSEYPEPKRRGTRVRDNDGYVWERKNTLWHHVDYGRPDEWRGRWPFYFVVSRFGPLLLL